MSFDFYIHGEFTQMSPRAALLLVVTTLFACGPVHKPPQTAVPPMQAGWHAAVDWDSASREAADVLASYLRVDTRNPPGNESRGARWMASLLEREGIAWKIVGGTPERGNLIARLPGDGSDKPLCLLSHTDVVPWDDAGWEGGPAPLSGEIDEDGVIWGRGALDMKGIGTVELMTMLWLKRLNVPLKRDVILLAVSDEEVGNTGARYVVDNHWGEIGCSHMINEGGIGVKDVFFDDQVLYAISVAEKGVLWLRMIVSGEPGHGSTPRPDEAPSRLIEAANVLAERKPEVTYHPSLDELFYNVGSQRSGLEKAVLTHPAGWRWLLKGQLLDNPATAAMITNTVHLTGLEGANQPNVVPSEVSALLDCRVQPDIDPNVVLQELRDLFADKPWIRFEVLTKIQGNGSPWDDPFFAALSRAITSGRAGVVAGPMVSVGFTDSILFRPLGVHAYGIAPFEVIDEDLMTMHGNKERVSVENVGRGLHILLQAVLDVSAADGGAVPSTPVAPPAWAEALAAAEVAALTLPSDPVEEPAVEEDPPSEDRAPEAP